MNTKHLQEKVLRDKMHAIWAPICSKLLEGSEGMEERFLKGLYKSQRVTRTFENKKAKRDQREEYELQVALTQAQI